MEKILKTIAKQDAMCKSRIAYCALPIAYCLLLLTYTQPSVAQQPITLQEAIALALKNNLEAKNEKLNAEYQQKQKAAAIDIPQTNLTSEYGQINSYYKDTKFGISQSISFPTVYSRQRSLQNEAYKSSVLNIAVKDAELKKQVSDVFYMLVYLEQKQKILSRTDSLYAAFLEKATLRFSKGETNILEKATAETQRGHIAIQLAQLKSDSEIMQLRFQLLLNIQTRLVPSTSSSKMVFSSSLDTAVVRNHPQIKILQQLQTISLANSRLEKSRMLPDLHVGYSNQSIQGLGANDVLYTKSYRFSAIQFGISLPIFFGSQKAKINASKTLEMISQNRYQMGLLSLKTEYEVAFRQYQTELQAVNYFEETALQNARIITQTADRQFEGGDINYLEWIMLTNNATAIQSNYADAVNDLNQTIIQLNYLTSN